MQNNPLDTQVGGSHYRCLDPQPIELFIQNDIPFPEANAIKYLARWRAKNGVEDLRKAAQYLQFAIERNRQKKKLVDKFREQLPLRDQLSWMLSRMAMWCSLWLGSKNS